MSSTTATSRALRSPELCQLICEQVGFNDRKTLYSLCLSSKTFLDPALDVLWYKLDNLAPLVRCMPRDLHQGAQDGKIVTLVSNCLFFFDFNPPSIIVFSKASSGERLGKI